MITPINRIPLENMTEGELMNSEPTDQPYSPEDGLVALLDHDDNPVSLSITLDWAMQLRDRTGRDWGECIRVAMIAYYG